MHPALTGLVKHGWDFIADSEPSSSRNETACMSHGTHVAGIIAMRDVNSRGLAGIAPGVTLGSYRIFGCPSSHAGSSFSISSGSGGGGSVVTSEDLVMAAMNRAFKDGMHVLNLSLGGGSSWSESPVAAAASLLAKRGMVIVASAGNDGGSGMFTHSVPGLGTEVIAVGSMNVPNVKNADGKFVVTVGSAEGQRYQLDAAYSAVANIGRLYEREHSLVYVGRCCSESDLAPLQNVRSPVALAEDGGCSIHEKLANLSRFGASGLVLFNFTHASAVPQPVLASNSTATGIAVAAISMVDGLYLTSTLLGGVPATIFASSKPPHIQVSGFSSAGPSPTLGLKPNIGAPGMLILSTLPSLDGKDVTYGIRSGTSMAAPCVRHIYERPNSV
ncbi:subtilisin-like protein [Ramicandelaber brevisporus]|nr:subtilisin-like protein [Ramicandelaber brevisporus]